MAWARPLDRLVARLPDGKVESLLSSGLLRQGVLLRALPAWDRQPEVLWMPAFSPDAAGPGRPGVLALPVPTTGPA